MENMPGIQNTLVSYGHVSDFHNHYIISIFRHNTYNINIKYQPLLQRISLYVISA